MLGIKFMFWALQLLCNVIGVFVGGVCVLFVALLAVAIVKELFDTLRKRGPRE